MQDEHLDPTTEITLETVKKRAVRGVVVLTGRTFLLSVLSLVATGFLTVFLEPDEFGVFWIVSAVINFLAYFSDVGLAAALIQKKEAVSDTDLKTTFLVQQFLVITLIVILFLASPLLSNFYDLTGDGRMLMYALGISFFLSSLKTIPSILLERELEFGKLVIPQVLENLTYNITAVYFAWSGYGVMAFAYAVLLRGIVGLVSMYALKPWMPGFAFSRESLRKLLTYGVPYQANTLLATLKDDGMTAVLGGILGPAGVGLLGWAQKWGQAPLRFFMDHVIKVTFPAFSRMQDEKEHLKRSLERSIFFITFLVFPSLAGLLILAPVLIEVIPRYDKWQPALLALGIIGINTVFASVTTQLTNLLNAIGKIKTTFKLMIMWTTLSWLIIPFLAIRFGVNGAALGYALVSASSVVAIIIVRKIIPFSFSKSFVKPMIATIVMSLITYLIREQLSYTFTSVWILVITGAFAYGSAILVLVGSSIKDDVKKSTKLFLSRN